MLLKCMPDFNENNTTTNADSMCIDVYRYYVLHNGEQCASQKIACAKRLPKTYQEVSEFKAEGELYSTGSVSRIHTLFGLLPFDEIVQKSGPCLRMTCR